MNDDAMHLLICLRQIITVGSISSGITLSKPDNMKEAQGCQLEEFNPLSAKMTKHGNVYRNQKNKEGFF
jgi:hypothetical protein